MIIRTTTEIIKTGNQKSEREPLFNGSLISGDSYHFCPLAKPTAYSALLSQNESRGNQNFLHLWFYCEPSSSYSTLIIMDSHRNSKTKKSQIGLVKGREGKQVPGLGKLYLYPCELKFVQDTSFFLDFEIHTSFCLSFAWDMLFGLG